MRKTISFLTVLVMLLVMIPMQSFAVSDLAQEITAEESAISTVEPDGVATPAALETPGDPAAPETPGDPAVPETSGDGIVVEPTGDAIVTEIPELLQVIPLLTTDSAISISTIAGVTAPVTGETPVATIADTAEYSATISWSGNPTTFAADTVYTATITITPLAGYTLTGVLANFFTVEGAVATNDAGSGIVTAVFPQTGPLPTITVSTIDGVTPPETDAVPVTTLPDTTQFSATVTWSGITTTVFEPNTTYTAIITITPLDGYTLTGVPANFFTVAGADEVTNATDSGIVTAVFPQTGPPKAPEFLFGYTNEAGDAISLVFNKEMAPPSTTEAGFTVAVNGFDYGSPVIYPIVVNSVGLDAAYPDTIVLTLDEAVQRGDIVTVGYKPGFVTAANGLALEAFSDAYQIYNDVPIEITSDLEGTWWYYDHVGWYGEDSDYGVDPNWSYPAPPYFLAGDDDPRGEIFNRHIVSHGNEVIFYGYGAPGYKDFLYLPSDDDAAKSFYFDLDLGEVKYHSMEGGGFLFNTVIETDEGTDKETLYGYCVLFTALEEYDYQSEEYITRYIAKLYQLDGIDVNAFAEGQSPYDTLEGCPPGNGITLLNSVDLPAGDLHSFTLEVSSSTVDLWDGPAKLIDTLALPEEEYGNGVGVIASYKDHGCPELSYFKFSSLSIEGIANLTAKLANDTEANLTFTAPTGATSVTVEQSKDGVNFTPSTVLSPIGATDTTATVTGLEPETTYFFRLLIQGGQYEGYSRVATALYTGPIKNLAAAPDDGKAHLTFSPPIGATEVVVMQSEDGGESFTPAAIEGELGTMPSSATVVGLTNGKQYWFKLIVTGGVNEGDSNIASATPNVQQHHDSGGSGKATVPKHILRFQIADTDCYLTSGSAIETKVKMDVAPIIFESRTLLPIRYVVEPLGGTALWDQSEQKATITLGKTTIVLWVGNNTAQVNGVDTIIDPLNKNVVPIIVDPGRVMLPLRFIAEALDCTVDWDAKTQKITVTDWY